MPSQSNSLSRFLLLHPKKNPKTKHAVMRGVRFILLFYMIAQYDIKY
jgi:hypothetical protein